MKQNSYIGLLDKDTITVKHPQTKKDVKLYRVISLKSFKLDNFDKLGKDKHKHAQDKLNSLNELLEKQQTHCENLKIAHESALLQENSSQIKQFSKEIDVVSNEIENIKNLIEIQQKEVQKCFDSIETKTIKIHTIGGWVESLNNLDDEPVWVDHRSRVFGNAKIVSGSLVSESSVIYGNAVIESSRIKNYARIHGEAHVKNSFVLDLTEIKGAAKVENSILNNSSMVFENTHVNNSTLNTGACVRGNAKVDNCILNDTSQIQGDSTVSHCTLQGRYVISEGIHSNENFYEDDNLKTVYSDAE